MYAVIETGGKQYRVEPGAILDVEREVVPQESRVVFDRVLMIAGDGATRLGNPTLAGAQVRARLIGEVRGPKVRIFKHKRRKQYQRNAGHRQDYLRVKIEEIAL